MKFESLIELDSSLKLIYGSPEKLEIIGISHSDCPQDNTFIFIKNRRFLSEVGRRLNGQSFKDCGMIIEEKVLSLLDEYSEIKEQFTWIASIESVAKGMCFYSKPFYDLKYKSMNFQVDGRKMGETKIDPSARISEGVFIGENVEIGKNSTVMPGVVILPNTKIGEDSIIFPNVTLYPFTEIGNRCRIHAGTVIGCDGFGYNFIQGEHMKIWHLYGVIIEDEVEIGCNTMIDNGAFIPTKIGYRSRIDNDVQISHNVEIGKNVIVCGKTGLAGSVEVGDYCAFGAQSGAAPGARLGAGAQVAAKSAVSENSIIPPNTKWGGYPARPVSEWLKAQAVVRKLMKK